MVKNTGKGPFQSAGSGKFVTTKYAQQHPEKTIGHRPHSSKSPSGGKKK
jgi:hypothetical protein